MITKVVVRTPNTKTEYSNVEDILFSPDIANPEELIINTTTDEDTYDVVAGLELTISFE